MYNNWIIEIEKTPLHKEVYTKIKEIKCREDLLNILISVLRRLNNSCEEMESVCNLQTEISSLDTDVTDPVKTNLEPAGKTCLKESETVCLKRKSGCKSASQTNWDKKRGSE